MKINITVRDHEPLPEATAGYLRKKVENLEHLSNQKPLSAGVILLAERHLKICEILLHLKGKDLFARGEGDDFSAATDDAVHKLRIQLEKYFKKKIDSKRRGQ